MQKEKISPEIIRQVLQEKFQRVRIEILLRHGYSYKLIQTVLKCLPNAIYLVKKNGRRLTNHCRKEWPKIKNYKRNTKYSFGRKFSASINVITEIIKPFTRKQQH